ncbi:MAG TPA: pyridoxal-phosphate dependent enzyme [Woeseiaceae bacterium]|nr:pyridoxal-phosphate dependent enzyme [Woeseiaceae bacterium]
MSKPLVRRYPVLGARIPALPLANLPTPVSRHPVRWCGTPVQISVKHDEKSGPLYGGNKVRKLEYLLQRACDRSAERIATYGAAGSNHALATSLYARRAGFACTCLLSHQAATARIADTLLQHQQLGTEIVPFGGARKQRVQQQRAALQGRDVFLIPLGGSSWVGNLAFVNAALELASQIERGEIPCPKRLYVALGTMGTAVGLALGLALTPLAIEVHAIRVTDEHVANASALKRLLSKTAALMHHFDAAIPAKLAAQAKIVLRHDFIGDGYARSNTSTERAISFARDALGIELESTYTGKALAALLHDIAVEKVRAPLFWNTYNAVRLDLPPSIKPDFARLPAEFRRYFDPRVI